MELRNISGKYQIYHVVYKGQKTINYLLYLHCRFAAGEKKNFWGLLHKGVQYKPNDQHSKEWKEIGKTNISFRSVESPTFVYLTVDFVVLDDHFTSQLNTRLQSQFHLGLSPACDILESEIWSAIIT